MGFWGDLLIWCDIHLLGLPGVGGWCFGLRWVFGFVMLLALWFWV